MSGSLHDRDQESNVVEEAGAPAPHEEPSSGSALYLEHRDTIASLESRLARRKGLSEVESEDFSSWAKIRLLRNNGEILRRFRGDSSWRTYLGVVLANLLRDYLDHRFGRWRPSAKARRLGNAAVELETLVRRDGWGVREAVRALRNQGHDLSDSEAFRMLASMPLRYRRRAVGPGALSTLAGDRPADGPLLADETQARFVEVMESIEEAMDDLAEEDQLILRLRFWEDLTVAQVARSLGIPQKPLYRRVNRLLDRLREHLTDRGLAAEELARWIA